MGHVKSLKRRFPFFFDLFAHASFFFLHGLVFIAASLFSAIGEKRDLAEEFGVGRKAVDSNRIAHQVPKFCAMPRPR